jgi:hypothetical protein
LVVEGMTLLLGHAYTEGRTLPQILKALVREPPWAQLDYA